MDNIRKNNIVKTVTVLLAGVMLIFASCRKNPADSQAKPQRTSQGKQQSSPQIQHRLQIAVTNTYLAAVVKDLYEPDTDVLSLSPPGMCPGHFDISPGQIQRLAKAKVLLLFDFQKGIENSLARLQKRGLKTAIITAGPGLCVPQTYLSICKQTADTLSQVYPDKAAHFSDRLVQIEDRLKKLTMEIKAKLHNTGLDGAEVLASYHQEKFARWLGLEPVADFFGSDIETVANIDNCLKKAKNHNIRFIIANKQQGSALSNALAKRLKAKMVVFSNFPRQEKTHDNFDEMLLENIRQLVIPSVQQ